MAVNYTPSLSEYNYTGSFRFWCQKVLPLVYDDSLSYYELLCKVVNYLNDVIKNVDGLKVDIDNLFKAFNQLQSYVNNYFDNLDVQEEINNKLDQMAQDGTLTELIEKYFKNLTNTVKFITPNEEQKAMYVDESLNNIASYMSVNSFSPCVVGKTIKNPVQIVYKYAQGKGYMGIMGIGEFVYNEKANVENENYNIAYLDCSTFLSLILKAIPFNQSPYAYAFTTPSPTQEELMKRAIENQSMNKPYTIDWFNNIGTANSSFIMNQSGCTLHYVSKNKRGETLEIDKSVLEQMETGDILYFGRSKDYDEGDYLGVYHCGYFIKTLDELNKYGAQYNQKYKAIDDNDGSNGYVVHCTSVNTTGKEYGAYVCINTLQSLIESIPDGSNWHNVMTCKPWSNGWNDNKSARRALLIDRRGDFTRFNTMTGADVYAMEYEVDTGMLKPASIGVRGITIKQNEDLNDYLKNGVWTIPNKTVANTIKNKPPTTLLYDLIGIGFGSDGQTGSQIALCTSTVEPKIYIRTTVNGNDPSPWTEISNNHQRGVHQFGSIQANKCVEASIQFSVPFSTIPSIATALNMTHNDPAGGNVSCAVRGVSTTGFKLAVYNNTGFTVNCGVYWLADN